MTQSVRPFVMGAVIAALLTISMAFAKRQNPVTILPEQAIIINRANQAIPVYAPEPMEVRLTEKNGTLIRADKPLKVEMNQIVGKWEYKSFDSPEDLIADTKTRSFTGALNKLGDDRWEFVTPYVFKRLKN